MPPLVAPPGMPTAAQAKALAERHIARSDETLVALSERIHGHPEEAFEEHQASRWLAEFLDASGFAVTASLAGLGTAIAAERGPGPLEISFCAEYDALPGIGHACGHNLIAAISAGAAVGAAAVADDIGLRVRVVGTPAEESGAGKALLLERGAFDGSHAALMAHPAAFDVLRPVIIARSTFEATFRGREAHASAYPEHGINAADAIVVAQVAVGLLRQRLSSAERVHGYVAEAGRAANVIPDRAIARYQVRAPTSEATRDLRDRVEACFRAGAVASGAELSVTDTEPVYLPMRHDRDLAKLYQDNAQALGRRFARRAPHERHVAAAAAWTDMGNVSQRLPAIQPNIGIGSWPAVNHQAAFAQACVGQLATRSLLDGALALAWTAIDAALDAPVRERLLRRTRPTGARGWERSPLAGGALATP